MRFKCFCTLFVLFLPFLVHGQEPVPSLKVRGQATLSKPAEQFSLVVSVRSRAVEASQALRENSQKMDSLIGSLHALGFDATEYQTRQFQLQPIYSQRPNNPPLDWTAEIIAFEVTNALTIRSSKLKLAGNVIDAVIQAGANSVDQITFGLRDMRVYRAEAIAAATSNAIADATTLASAAEIDLVRILSISLDEEACSKPPYQKSYLLYSESGSLPPIQGGMIEIHAEVEVTYEVE